MDQTEVALSRIEQAFLAVANRFHVKISYMVQAEDRRRALHAADRKRKRAIRRKELLAMGKSIPKVMSEDKDDEKSQSAYNATVKIYSIQEKSYELSTVLDLNDLKQKIQAYLEFMEEFKESDNQVLYDASYSLCPKIQKLLSLMHIHKAHPRDAIRRANIIIEEA